MLTALLSLYTATALLTSNPSESKLLSWKDAILQEATQMPKEKPQNIAPVIRAKSVYSIDMKTGKSFYEKNIYDHRPIASITKLMTAIIILEENNLNDVVTVSSKASQISGSKIWLAQGEKITLENLLYAILIHSANDAAYAAAEYNSPNINDFVAKMNKKAAALGLQDTHYTNPIGFDDPENYSTAYDLSILARYAYEKSFIRQATVIKEMKAASTNGKFQHELKTSNDLLGSYLKVLGLKTGTTDLAGQCLVSIIQNSAGNNIITIMLDSPSRYQETKVLTDWIFRTYRSS